MGPLQVDNFYFKVKENAEKHNTYKYDIVQQGKSVVRRGQPFQGVLSFTRPYDDGNDVVQLVFQLDEAIQYAVTIEQNLDARKGSWSANLLEVSENTLTFDVSAPVTLPVGNWAVKVITYRRDSDAHAVYNCDRVFILFNPFIPDDQTYMEDSFLLQEYVLNDIGKIWRGDTGKPWIFGQFDAIVLDACMFVLDRAGLDYSERGNPVAVTRALSRIVNAEDDFGVLVGGWDSTYEDGTPPSSWTGSVEILEKYLETKQPVRYGQCWVFAGVVNTVCRALGIPSRVVTNLVSGHDSNNTLSVELYFNEEMKPIKNNDSIWNFHGWNDVWMSRPDLRSGFDGWQSIDATAQEKSGGLFQCGPAPLKAIKNGDLDVNYDVGFMLASVNADLLKFRKVSHSEEYLVVETDDYYIGRNIFTKKPLIFDPRGEEDRDDIISEYKYSERTKRERQALMNGIRHSENAKKYYELANKARKITFKLRKLDFVDIGKDFEFSIDVTNNSDVGRDITVTLIVYSVFYNGKVAEEINKIDQATIWLGSRNEDKLELKVKPEEYLPKLVEGLHLKLSATASVRGTDQSWADDDDFTFTTPKIKIEFNKDLIIGQSATAVLTFENPLHLRLTGCEFRVSSTGFVGRAVIVTAPDTAPGQRVVAELFVVPNKLGVIEIVATFQSAELNHVNGATTVQVLGE